MFTIDNKNKRLTIEIKPFMPPHLNKKDNCYQYLFIALLFDSKGVCVQHEAQTTEWFNQKVKPNNQVFNFNKPVSVQYYLLCIELRGGINGIATGTFARKGMAVVGVSQRP